MENIDLYLDLLEDTVGIRQPNLYLTTNHQPAIADTIPNDRVCCENMEIIEDTRGEGYYCYNCGLCRKSKVIRADKMYVYSNMGVTKKRMYNPLSHFKEHLRRYMGGRFTNIPAHIIEATKCVDIHSTSAYKLMREKLKELKCMKLYKEIFTLIYMHGGKRVPVTYDQYENCIQDFKNIHKKFLEKKFMWNRHSVPSNYMLMKILLEKNGHRAYYELPELKIEKCKLKFHNIFKEIN